MSCTCIAKIDEMMAPLNGRLGTRFTADSKGLLQTAILTVEKVNPRGKKPPGLLAKFCPICGAAYDPPEMAPFDPTQSHPTSDPSSAGV